MNAKPPGTSRELAERLRDILNQLGTYEKQMHDAAALIDRYVKVKEAELRACVLEEAAKHVCSFSSEDWTVRCSCGWFSDECNERGYAARFALHIRTLS